MKDDVFKQIEISVTQIKSRSLNRDPFSFEIICAAPISYPNSNYNKKFSRKWFEVNARSAEDDDDMYDWCRQVFGDQPKSPDAWCRWYRYNKKTFRFRDQKDADWARMRVKV
jgi:hypothetical protein